MDLGLKGRTALVTGSSRGIGKAIAIAMAKEGCNLILCARNSLKLAKVADEIGLQDSGWIEWASVDAVDPNSIKTFFNMLTNLQINKIDVLVNNVGGGTGKPLPLFGLTESDWLEMYKLNVLSMVWFTENALPFLERSDQARIINIGSATSHQPGLFNPHYGAAKSAMDFLTKRMANELAPKGICVNIIGPHALDCENFERDVRDRAQRQNITTEQAREVMVKEVTAKIPMGRQGVNEDVANLAVYLASALASFITGAYIPVDGGTYRGRP